MVGDLVDIGTDDMSQNDPYDDESCNDNIFPILDGEPEVVQGWGNQYLKS